LFVFHQVAPLSVKQLIKMKLTDICSEQHGIQACQKLCKLVQLF